MYPLRAFLSYSSEDRDIAAQFANALSDMGLKVLWDPQLVGGSHFSAEIRAMIRRSHLFFVLLSENSAHRPWVHQETGFALGVGVPVVPIALDDTLPDAFSRDLQAVRLPSSEFHRLSRLLPASELERRVFGRSYFWPDSFVLLETHEERTERLAEYEREALTMGGGHVRICGSLSSFCLPRTRPVADDLNDVWKRRDGLRQRSPHIYQKLYEERCALDDLVLANGCSLILHPSIRMDSIGDAALVVRLEELRRFLSDEHIPNVRALALSVQHSAPRNILIVGDWFYAESRSAQAGGGYEHTFCTWHAPTVLRKVKEFDEEFESIVNQTGLSAGALRAAALATVDSSISTVVRRIEEARQATF